MRSPGTLGRRALGATAATVATLVLAAGLGACGASSRPAPTIEVVTTLWPLAQVVSSIGGGSVRVDDLATDGTDPRSIRPSASQRAAIDGAAVVVEAGGGFQPAVEAAAAHARRVVALAPRFGPATSGAWLDPALMARVLPAITTALAAANPAAAGRYRDGEQDVAVQLAATSGDYEDALTACPRSQLAGPDDLLSAVSTEYRLHLHVLGASSHPSPGEVATAAGTLETARVRTAFTEPWVSSAVVTAAASQAGVRTRSYDTLETPPTGGARHLNYQELLETDLSTLAGGFGCPSSTDSQN